MAPELGWVHTASALPSSSAPDTPNPHGATASRITVSMGGSLEPGLNRGGDVRLMSSLCPALCPGTPPVTLTSVASASPPREEVGLGGGCAIEDCLPEE